MSGSVSEQESQSSSNGEGSKEDQINTKDPFALDPDLQNLSNTFFGCKLS
jgi:hypothetical protein